ncbi:MAG: DNA cytosine methyltransferase [Bacteroidia bacterium]
MNNLFSLEICAGAGGQALGLEAAGFEHVALVEIDADACRTLRLNRPTWLVVEQDLRTFHGDHLAGQIDLLAGGVPCPPFSIAGRQLGEYDERDLFPEAIRLVQECRPKAIMIENVRGILSSKFEAYRQSIVRALHDEGYSVYWKLLHASDFGLPQLRPRAVLVALQHSYAPYFAWPEATAQTRPTVGEVLYEEMASKGWEQVESWRMQANDIAPTLVGGSKKHGGPDLGPTRAKAAWSALGVDAMGIADDLPACDFEGKPRLTVRMAAMLQGFPASRTFSGKKTAA